MLYMLVAYRPPDKDVYYSTKQRNHIKPASCLGFVVFLQSELSKEMHQTPRICEKCFILPVRLSTEAEAQREG